MQDEEAAVTAWGLDLTHGEVGALSKHIAPGYAACLCPQQMFGSLTWAQGFGNHSSCSQKVSTLDMHCVVMHWLFGASPSFLNHVIEVGLPNPSLHQELG